MPVRPADSKQVITACDDNHAHLYDAEHAELIEAFSGRGSAPAVWRWLRRPGWAATVPLLSLSAMQARPASTAAWCLTAQPHAAVQRTSDVSRAPALSLNCARSLAQPMQDLRLLLACLRSMLSMLLHCCRARVVGAVGERALQRHRLCHRQQRQQGQAVGYEHADMRAGGRAA